MNDPIRQAIDTVDMNYGSAEEIVYSLSREGLLPSYGEWGVLDAGRPRYFGSEAAARRHAARHPGMKLIHAWAYEWQIVE